jgi:MYXO-CTERM domain-containing protein
VASDSRHGIPAFAFLSLAGALALLRRKRQMHAH